MQMVMADSVAEVLDRHFVPLQIPGQPTTEMIQIVVVEDAVCPGACSFNHMYRVNIIYNIICIAGLLRVILGHNS